MSLFDNFIKVLRELHITTGMFTVVIIIFLGDISVTPLLEGSKVYRFGRGDERRNKICS